MRYVVVGGVAVAAHGYVRFTADLDLMLDLGDEKNVRLAIEILKDEGFVPRIPFPIEAFAESVMRESWVRDKNMLVYGLDSDQLPTTHIDLLCITFWILKELSTTLSGSNSLQACRSW